MNVTQVADLGPGERRALFERDAGVEDARDTAREIIERVRDEGDVALREYAREFDDVEVGNLEVTDDAERAVERIDDDLRAAIETAIGNVREFHEAQVPDDWRREFSDGRELGRRFRPLDRVGVYVPGGAEGTVVESGTPARQADGVEHDEHRHQPCFRDARGADGRQRGGDGDRAGGVAGDHQRPRSSRGRGHRLHR